MNDGRRREEVEARRFDWALREVVGDERAPDVTAAVLARAAAGDSGERAEAIPALSRRRWLALAALFLLGVFTVLGVALALAARTQLQAAGTPTAVVSMPSWELFEAQDAAYRARVLGAPGGVRVGCEAALRFGWDRWLGERGGFVGMRGFGASGGADELYRHFGITAEAIVAEARRLLAGEPQR